MSKLRRACFLPAAPIFQRKIDFMAPTKFSAGERVSVSRGASFGVPTGAVEVLKALPRDAGPQRYRIRASGENFERVIDEARLEAIAHE